MTAGAPSASATGMLGEPTNDVDSEMLTAMEDLLDSWPGTLIVVSHDRYLLERVTDQQYAILDGRLRHVPGGVDEYLRLRSEQDAAHATDRPDVASQPGSEQPTGAVSGAQRHAAQKEISSIERRLDKLTATIEAVHQQMAEDDPSDYERLQQRADEVRELESEVEQLEERWLELSEQIA